MLRGTRSRGGSDFGGGLVTLTNFFTLNDNQTPNAMDVKFGIGGTVEKRFGSTTINTVGANTLASTAGWAMFDFGAGANLRWLVVSAGTSIYASSNRGVTWVIIASSRSQDYQSFERSKPYLIATANSQDAVVYWAGSPSTFMLSLAPGSAPNVKYAVDFQGFLLLMNSNTRKRGVYYADNNLITTDPWNNNFDLPSSFDDEITGTVILNKKLYVFTKYKIFRVSYVGGNPDFSYQDVKDWGAVPRTIKKITLPDVGEVIICLSWDKHIRIFDGSEDEIISDRIEPNNGMSPVSLSLINTDSLEKSFAEVDTNEQVYKLWVAIAPSSQITHLMAYNYRVNAFYAYANQPFMSAIMAESGSTNNRVLIGTRSSGFVYWMDTLTTDAGTAIPDYFDSPFFYGRTPKVASKSQRISFYFSVTSSGTVFYQDRLNFNNAFGPTRDTVSFASTGGVVQIQKTIDIPATQNVYQYRLSSSSSTAQPWKLNRVDYELTDLGIGKA